MNAIVDPGTVVAAKHGITRSSGWRRVRAAHLQREPACACCDPAAAGFAVQVHHIFPFHYCVALGRPDLELDDRNLITLCETEASRPAPNHHLLIGHLGSFASANLDARDDAATRFHALAPELIRADATWIAEVAARLTPLDQMT